MFTGIIETMGRVREARDGDRLRHLTVAAEAGFLQGLEAGDSVAVDGACLTAVEVEPSPSGEGAFRTQVILSTLERTVAAGYRPGSRVNLERAMAVGDRFEGHIVQGHVDGLGEIIQIRSEGDTRFLELRIPAEVHGTTILHGSIALNGVSLTVNRLLDGHRVEVALIPHTWTHTNLSELDPGDSVNVEGDLIGKYVGRLLRGPGAGGEPLSPERLREMGY